MLEDLLCGNSMIDDWTPLFAFYQRWLVLFSRVNSMRLRLPEEKNYEKLTLAAALILWSDWETRFWAHTFLSMSLGVNPCVKYLTNFWHKSSKLFITHGRFLLCTFLTFKCWGFRYRLFRPDQNPEVGARIQCWSRILSHINCSIYDFLNII
jgi:hypothetical protein